MHGKLFLKFKERKILKNIFLSTFGISVFFIIIAVLSGFSWFERMTERWVIQDDQKSLSSYNIAMDNYITSAEKSLETMYENVYVKQIIISNEKNWTNNMSIIANDIVNNISVNSRFHSIYIFGTTGLLLKSSNNIYPTTEAIDELAKKAFTDSYLKPFNLWKYTDVYGKDNQILSLSMGDLSNENNKYISGIELNLDIGRITKELFPQIGSNESYLILDTNGTVLGASSERYRFKDRIANEAAIKGIWGRKESLRTFSVTDAGMKFAVSYVYSKENGYYIIHILPYESFLNSITKARFIFILCGISLVFISLCISFLVALRVYDPINEVVDNVILPKSLNVKNENNKKQKSNELSAISDMIINMAQQLNHYSQEKESELMVNYLSARHQNPNLPKYFMEYLKLAEKNAGYCVAVLRICHMDNFINDNTEEEILFRTQSICGIAKSKYEAIANVFTYIIDNKFVAVVLLPKENIVNVQPIMDISKQIIHLVPELVSLNIDISISELNTKPENLRQVYQTTKDAASYSFILGRNVVITEEQIQNCTINDSDTGFDLKPIISSVKVSNKAAFISCFEEMTTYIKRHSLQNGYDLLISLACEMCHYSSEISHNLSDLSSFRYEKVTEKTLSLHYLDEALPWFLELFDNVHKSVSQMQSTGTTDIVKSAIKYINSNYSDINLNSQFLAEKFNITSQYFSRIFNEYTNCAFPDYLSNIRLEQAKSKLTEEPLKNIQVICEEVGYTNASYFTALFKKKYGISPSKYRLTNRID